jgi:hypothetical protein
LRDDFRKETFPEAHVRALEYQDAEAAGRLGLLGLTAADLGFVLRGADAEARMWSPVAPPIMAGLTRWGKTSELLRQRLLPRGWTQDNPNGLPRTISPDRDIAIVATAGDGGTGAPGASPSNKHPKGIETMRAIGRNVQLAFDFAGLFEDPDLDGDREDEVRETWLLLYYVTPDTIRAELSLPGGITPAGYVDAWRERIILSAIDLTSAAAERRGIPGAGGAADVMVAVERH